jgi:NADP-dependent 3-hydroxy acid dehydrogenase YdfG
VNSVDRKTQPILRPDRQQHRSVTTEESGTSRHFYFIKAGLDRLRAAHGDVVLIGSISGRWPDMSGLAYAASKAGIGALAATAGFEEHVNGVRFSAINPGAVDIPLLFKRPAPQSPEQAAAMLRPDDVAEACLLLLQLPRRAQIPELTILPTRLQSLGKTSDANAKPAPE